MPEDKGVRAKRTIQQIVADLYRIDGRLADLAESLPTPEDHFEMLAELRACVEIVREDRLADAIETLHLASTSSHARARQRWIKRQQCMAAAMA